MTPRTFGSFDEITSHIGQPIGPTEWLVLDQRRIDVFADVTDDARWIHVDQERAARGPFNGTIAHGYLTLSLLPSFGRQLFRLEMGRARINYGINKARFPTPVPSGARVRAHATFTELSEANAGHLLVTRYTVDVEAHAKPACVAEVVALVLSRG